MEYIHDDGLSLVRLLAVMGGPDALAVVKAVKARRERRVLGRARVDAKAHRTRRHGQVADAHLREGHTVARELDAEVVLAAGEPIPHHALVGGNLRRCPVRPAAVGDHAPQVLEALVLVLHGRLEPVL